MAGTSADEVKSTMANIQNRALETVHAQYEEYFIHSDKAMYYIEKNNAIVEAKLAEKEALLLQKTIVEDYLFSQTREIILEKDLIFTEKNALISENMSREALLLQKTIIEEYLFSRTREIILEKDLIFTERNALISENTSRETELAEKEELLLQKDYILTERNTLISEKERIIIEKDNMLHERNENLLENASMISEMNLVINFIRN